MRLDKLTIKGQEAVDTAIALAEGMQHQQVEPEHITASLLDQPEGLARPILAKIGANASTVRSEIEEALRAYDKYIICIHKTPDEFEASVLSLVNKAIRAFEDRGPHMRHGIALDRHITVILSQTADSEIPLCGIYFNLHSPYSKKMTGKPEKARA